MTHRKGDTIVVTETAPAECTQCSKVAELRPYGKDGAFVCFQCGMKDEPEMEKQFNKLHDGSRDI